MSRVIPLPKLPQYEKPKARKPAEIPASVVAAKPKKPPQFVRIYGNKNRPHP